MNIIIIAPSYVHIENSCACCDSVVCAGDDMLCTEAVLEVGGNETCGLFAKGQEADFFDAKPWAQTDPQKACKKLKNSGNLTGRIAVADKSTCSFEAKASAALEAGAVALVIVNNETKPVIVKMLEISSRIPAVMVSKEAGELLRTAAGANITIKQPGVHIHIRTRQCAKNVSLQIYKDTAITNQVKTFLSFSLGY